MIYDSTVGNSAIENSSYLKIVNSFELPKLHFVSTKKQFEQYSISLDNVFVGFMKQKFDILKQKVERSNIFSKSKYKEENNFSLESVNSLKGNVLNSTKYLFGLLSKKKDGSFYLEDLDGKVKLDLNYCEISSGIYTEGMFVLIEGNFDGDVFHVSGLGHPPEESRVTTNSFFGHVDFSGTLKSKYDKVSFW